MKGNNKSTPSVNFGLGYLGICGVFHGLLTKYIFMNGTGIDNLILDKF